MPQQIQTASIAVPSLLTKDATGSHTLDLVRMLKNEGVATEIVCNFAANDLPADALSLVRIEEHPPYNFKNDLTIFQYPIWSSLAESLRFSQKTTLFWYHGVTPPKLWASSDGHELMELSERRTTLAWHADLAVCASPFTADELHRHSGYPKERIRVVPLGVDVSEMTQKPSVEIIEQLRTRWNLQDKQVLLYVGRIAGNKRIDLLIEGLATLADTFPSLVLLLVGDSSSTQGYQELTKQLIDKSARLGIQDRVIFTDKVEKVAPYYHLADIFVHASQHEGFCIPLIEAMAAGVPVVASASGAMPWVLNAHEEEPNTMGLLFSEGNSGELASQIKRLLLDHELYRAKQSNAQAYVCNFDKVNFAQRMLSVISEATTLSTHKLVPPLTDLAAVSTITSSDYRVRSHIPILGRLIERIRVNLTSHLKSGFIDPILRRQANYNRLVVDEVDTLGIEIMRLRAEIKQLQQKSK